MNHSQGVCPVCEKPLSTGDDVVICPECGAPYHRSCYQKAGQCVFSGQHGPGFEYKAPAPEPQPGASPPAPGATADDGATSAGPARPANDGAIACPHCGTLNSSEAIFCLNCGQPMHGPAAGPTGGAGAYGAPVFTGEVDGISARDWTAFIGRSAPIYLQRMAAMQSRNTKVSMTFSAFLLGPFYFAYRKMWGWSILSLGLTFLFFIPQVFWATAQLGTPLIPALSIETWEMVILVCSYLSLAVRVVSGLFALFLYRRESAEKIRAARAQHPSDTDYYAALPKRGGVSIAGVCVSIAAYFLFVFVLFLLFGNEVLAAIYML